LILNLNS